MSSLLPHSPVTVTTRSLARVLRDHELGDLPLPLRPDPLWMDVDGDRVATAVMRHEFQAAGLTDQSNRLCADVLGTLRVLAQSSVEYVAFYVEKTQQYRVVVA